MKNRILNLILLGVSSLLASGAASVYGEDSFLPKETVQLVHKGTYTLRYNDSREQADWVMYSLGRDQLLMPMVGRTDDFRADPAIRTGSAELRDYKGSGYDRGHLCPAADRAYSEKAMRETFYMSNMSPQKPGFNRGIWKELESLVRDWASEYGEVIVVTGPCYRRGILEEIGPNGVDVPAEYFKVVLRPGDKPQAIGFVMPNEASSRKLSAYAVSVDQVEKAIGFDLFSSLEDKLEDRLESESRIKYWSGLDTADTGR